MIGDRDNMSSREFIPVHIAVLTVSDTRTLSDDKSGDLLVERINKAGHILVDRKITKDNKDGIVSILNKWLELGSTDVILTILEIPHRLKPLL